MQVPKLNTGGIFKRLQTSFNPSPAIVLAACSVQRPATSKAWFPQPPDTTNISFLISSFVRFTVFQSCGPFLRVEQFARATTPLIFPAAITSTKGSSLLPRAPKTASVEKPAIAF